VIGEGGELIRSVEQEMEFLAEHSRLAKAIVEDTQKINRQLKLATDNAIDLNVLVPLALAAGSFIFLGGDVPTPLWATLGIFSFNSFVTLHSPARHPQGGPAGDKNV
jgi:hypothetical protein